MKKTEKTEKTAKPVVALIYDFDGTLSPGNMQEYGFIPATGLSKEEFWSKSRQLTESQDASSILCYMKLMVDEALQNGLPLTRNSLRQYGSNVQLFKGVTTWFDAINSYGQSRGVTIQHYINSSGLKEIIEGTPIAEHFSHIYACSFLYAEQGQAIWPAVAVDFTAKTQFLFMINKGIKDVKDNHLVNKYISPTMRPIPFSRMIYFGDGETDIPCMRLVKEQGGTSIAVFDPDKENAEERRRAAERLIKDNRVNFVCPADYTTSNIPSSSRGTFNNIPNSLKEHPNSHEDHRNLLEDYPNSLEDHPNSLEDNRNLLEDYTNSLKDHPNSLEDNRNLLEDYPNSLEDHPNSLEDNRNLLEDYTNSLKDHPNSLEDNRNLLEDYTNSLKDQTTQKLFDVVKITIDKIKADFDYHSIHSSE